MRGVSAANAACRTVFCDAAVGILDGDTVEDTPGTPFCTVPYALRSRDLDPRDTDIDAIDAAAAAAIVLVVVVVVEAPN